MLTVLFRFVLTTALIHENIVLVFTAALLYGVFMFTTGWIFGKKDHEYLPIYDIGFRFHFATYLAYNLVSELWFLLGFAAPTESVAIIHIGAGIWLVFDWHTSFSIKKPGKPQLTTWKKPTYLNKPPLLTAFIAIITMQKSKNDR